MYSTLPVLTHPVVIGRNGEFQYTGIPNCAPVHVNTPPVVVADSSPPVAVADSPPPAEPAFQPSYDYYPQESLDLDMVSGKPKKYTPCRRIVRGDACQDCLYNHDMTPEEIAFLKEKGFAVYPYGLTSEEFEKRKKIADNDPEGLERYLRELWNPRPKIVIKPTVVKSTVAKPTFASTQTTIKPPNSHSSSRSAN